MSNNLPLSDITGKNKLRRIKWVFTGSQGSDLVDVSGMGRIRKSDVSVSHEGDVSVKFQVFDDQVITMAGSSFSDLSLSDFVLA